MIFLLVEMQVVVEHLLDVIIMARIVVGVIVLDWQEVRVPHSSVANRCRNYNEENGNAAQDIGDGVEGCDQGRLEVSGDDGPVLRAYD